MKVVYRSMLREIERAVETAKLNMRTIDHIEVTPAEYSELLLEVHPLLVNAVGMPDPCTVHGVKIKRVPREPAR
jgi:hypothetical protein